MSKSNYYDILNIDIEADNEQIKKAYRVAAKKYHPDMNKEVNSEELFKKVKEAYDTLIDDGKRREYDKEFSIHSRRSRRRMAESQKESVEDFEEMEPKERSAFGIWARIIGSGIFFFLMPLFYVLLFRETAPVVFYYAWLLLLYLFTKWIWGLSVVCVAIWCALRLFEGNGNQAYGGIIVFLAIGLIVWIIKPSVFELR